MNTHDETMEIYKTFTCPDCQAVKKVPEPKNESESAMVILCDECGKACEVIVDRQTGSK